MPKPEAPRPPIATTGDVQIVPVAPDRWDDVAGLFGEGGDPKTCWCMFWRLRSKDWSFANTAAVREGFHRLVDQDLDPAPGFLRTETGAPSVGSALRRATTTSA